MALMISLLAGCVTTGKESDALSDDYYARNIPGLMSPAEKLYQIRTSSSPSSLIRKALLAEHERWQGTPYRLGGDGPEGIDCSALVQNIFADKFSLDLPRTTRRQVNEGAPVTRETLEPGDLVFFRPPGSRHVGIYVGDERFLHASTSRGVMISSLNNVYWKRYYWKARRPLEPVHVAQLSQTQAAIGAR
jgi:cell wall-associated NlpC family hydrolase